MFGKKRRLVCVLATRHAGALVALEGRDMERREAMTTEGLYRALPGAHLVIVDLESLTETPCFSRERLMQVLAAGNVLVVDGPTFAASPDEWLARAGTASGIAEALLPVRLAFVSLSGGVGKTTLSLSLARYFREQTGLPTVVAELTSGPSGLLALLATNGRGGHIYEVITQDKPWPTWNGITLAAMDWRMAQMLSHQAVEAAWMNLASTHVLTIFDAPAHHPLWSVVKRIAQVIVVTDSRLDALASAVFIAGKEFPILVNKGGLTARLALDRQPVATIPFADNASSFPPSIGRRLLRVAYPDWRK
ncbi:hypothetical protein [Thermogutta sp.]|uniref:hypothetical protein n=1 Tax=Thermogutta sp. TaxID=1962930 RepID=UPI00321FFF60